MSNNTPYLRHLNTPYQIFSPISSSSYNNPMSTPPKKLNLDFILNKEYDQSNDEEKRRRRSRPVTSASSSSSADVPTLSHNHPDSASHRSTPASSSRSRPSQPSSSRDHSGVPQSARMFQCETCLKTFVERGMIFQFFTFSKFQSFYFLSLP